MEGRIAAGTDRLLLYAWQPLQSGLPLEAWDYAGNRESVKIQIKCGHLAPDGRVVAIGSLAAHWLRDWVIAHGMRWPFPHYDEQQIWFVDVRTGQEIGRLPSKRVTKEGNSLGEWVEFSPDGRLFAVADKQGIRIWDVPPRKSRAWFVPLAAGLALPVAGLARRRVRRLRKAAVGGR
jgi:hypothetical protein